MNTLSLLKTFQNEINQLFDKSVSGMKHLTLTNETNTWHPEVDIEDQGNHYQISANLPGVDSKDLEIYFNNGLLTIKGKLESKKQSKNKNYIQSECSYGEFSRTFSLLDASDEEKIEAKFKNGVLNIHIPKTKNSSPKRIEVKS